MSCDVPAGTRRKPRVRVTSLFCRSFLRSFTLASSFYGSRSPYIESREFTVAIKPLALFVKHDGVSARSSITCQYKCGNRVLSRGPQHLGRRVLPRHRTHGAESSRLAPGQRHGSARGGSGQRPRRLFGRIRKCRTGNRIDERQQQRIDTRGDELRRRRAPTRKTRSPSLTDTIKPS